MTGCLLIHGYTGGPDELAPLTRYLQEHTDWEIEVPVLPGHGDYLDLAAANHKHWVEKAESALQRMQQRHETIYIIGFSMGGLIAAYLSAKYKVGKLVLLAAAGKFLPIRQISVDIIQFIYEAMTGELKNDRYFASLKRKAPGITWRGNLEFLKLVKLGRKSLERVKAPVLIAQGLRDGLVPYRTAYFLAEKLRTTKSEVVLFEKSRHFLCLGEDRDNVNKLVYDFLKDKEKSQEKAPVQK